MARFKVRSPDGRSVILSSLDNTPPTEQELEQVFASIPSQKPRIQPISPEKARQQNFSTILGRMVTAQLPLRSMEEFGKVRAGQPIQSIGGEREIGGFIKTVAPLAAGGAIGAGIKAGALGPMVARTVATRGVPGFLARMGLSGTESAVAGATTDLDQPLTPQQRLQKIGQYTKLGVIGVPAAEGIGRGILATAKAFRNVKDMPKFLGRVREKIFTVKNNLSTQFGDDIARLEKQSPNTPVKLGAFRDELLAELDKNPSLKNSLESAAKRSRSTILNDFIDTTNIDFPSDNLTLSQSQELVKQIKKAPGFISRTQQLPGSFKDTDLDIKDLVDDIRVAQLTPFKQFETTLKNYRDVMEDYRKVKGMLSEANLEGAITGQKLFRSSELRKRAERLTGPELFREIKATRRMKRLPQTAGKTAGVAGGLLALKAILGLQNK